MRSEAQSKLAAGGVSHHQRARYIEFVLFGYLRKKAESAANVFKGSRPAPADIADAPILHVPGSDSCPRKRSTQMPGVLQIVLCAPESTMDIHHNRNRPAGLWNAQVTKLI